MFYRNLVSLGISCSSAIWTVVELDDDFQKHGDLISVTAWLSATHTLVSYKLAVLRCDIRALDQW
jgi:hypothetical protein